MTGAEQDFTETTFGGWVRQRRRMLDLTQQSLANQIGIARITLRRIEANTLKPSEEVAYLLLEKFGIPETERPLWIPYARNTAAIPSQSTSTPNPSNLPAPLTSFIGREKEQIEISRLISKSRLVTLSGPGGVGKTRLSLKVGELLLKDYRDGVWFLDLAPLSDPTLLPQTITALFGLSPQSNVIILDILVNFLRAKSTLLIFDNCEHLLDACAHLVGTLLMNCPKLRILITSREPLGMPGESIYRVPSFQLPDIRKTLQTVWDNESVRLFEDRAQLVQFDFSVTLENTVSVVEICRRLDGIPLAIELAAAKLEAFSIEQIAQQLEESFSLLTAGSQIALPRQQTLRNSIHWSWGLLTEAEQTCMRQLSIFTSGCSLEAAQAVCDGNVMNLISSLVKKSLIFLNQEAGRETRYHFHEMIRQYASEKLVESGEEGSIRTRHLKYYVLFANQADSAARGLAQIGWNARLLMERDNLRSALEWGSQTDLEAGLYLAGRIWFFWESFNLHEAAHWLSNLTNMDKAASYPRAKAKALLAYSRILELLQKFEQARIAAKQALNLSRSCNDTEGEIDSLLALGDITDTPPDLQAEFAQQAYVLSQGIHDKWRQAFALGIWGWDHREEEQARARWEKSTSLFREIGDLNYLVNYLCHLAQLEIILGYLDSAKVKVDEAELLSKRINRKRTSLTVLHASGQLYAIMGDTKKARTNLQQALTLGEELGERMESLWCRVKLGSLAFKEGKVVEAKQLLKESVKHFHSDGTLIGVVFAIEKLASIYVLPEPILAASLLGWADFQRAELRDPRWRIEQADIDLDIESIVSKVGSAHFQNAYDKGQGMTLDEAVAFALEGS